MRKPNAPRPRGGGEDEAEERRDSRDDREPRGPREPRGSRTPGGERSPRRERDSRLPARTRPAASGTGDRGASAGREVIVRSGGGRGPSADLEVFGRRSASSPEGAGRDRRDHVVSTGLTDRLRERRRAQRTLLLKRLAWSGGAVVVVAVLVWALLFSPMLALCTDAVEVVGSDSPEDVAEVREVLESRSGTSLVRLDVRELGDEVAGGITRVKSATVTRAWPHGLSVELTLRVPVAQHRVDGGYEILDGEAVVLETVEQPPGGLVDVTAEDGQALTQEQVGAVATAVGSLDEGIRARVVSGSATQTGQVTLMLTDGARVVWGDSTDTALKASVLAVLLTQTASTYDVSSPHNPTTS